MFQKKDLITKGTIIFDTYMSMDAKFKVNVSDSLVNECKAILAMPMEDSTIDGALFLTAQREIESFLNNDVWGRYVDLSKGDGKIGAKLVRSSTADSLLDESILGDREKMREAVVQLMRLPQEIENFRVIARGLECEESIDFYMEIKEYQLLFNSSDFADRSVQVPYTRIWI